ncbi:MAG: tRNA preQ1(34) S-adenosylmethionine ribosyltransferase-isomerase QueA [Rhodospirillaceae bacterium]|nr:MAG: tRNA preQ1(34) S-adenosylmethionine ribosyltransferase-isomerase QueA [Rhodospirillaceae bacterium]
MQTADFDFQLPEELIAQHPVTPRDAARLLHVGRDRLADRLVRDLPDLLQPGDLMIFNDTKVIPAQLFGERAARAVAGSEAAKIEITLHKRESLDSWRAFAKPGRRLKVGDTIRFGGDFTADVIEKTPEGEVVLRFAAAGAELFAALHRHGQMPLPPYIRKLRPMEARDAADYQTVYARAEGAVAAPTAGLHFTPALFAALDARGIEKLMVTLHVGAGTFLPVKVENIAEHKMHAEYGEISPDAATTLNRARAEGRRIVSVGTTSLRLLESATDEMGHVRPFTDDTDIFITPGYRFRCVDVLMTNFHLPKSTLFMLVSAFAGMNRMRAAYDHAIRTGYRFFSYGDSSLLERSE